MKKFCSKCGTLLEAQDMRDYMWCPTCCRYEKV